MKCIIETIIKAKFHIKHFALHKKLSRFSKTLRSNFTREIKPLNFSKKVFIFNEYPRKYSLKFISLLKCKLI